jgi:alpha-tubulin suppressor-like RCC1 family protein
MGNGSDSQMEKTPVAVKGLTRIKMLAVGGFHNCVLAEDGKVWCWGKNDEGQLGVGDTQNRPTPVSIQSGGRRFSTVAAGEAHTCALTAAGKAFCWGRNASGQLGDGSTRARNRPVEVKGIDDLTLISPGGGYLGGFTCALKKNGTVWCWGNNLYGQLGGRAISNRQPRPRRVAGLKNIVSVQAGGLHTCAVAENGETRCWGRNNDGQLGLGNLDDREKPGLLKK